MEDQKELIKSDELSDSKISICLDKILEQKDEIGFFDIHKLPENQIQIEKILNNLKESPFENSNIDSFSNQSLGHDNQKQLELINCIICYSFPQDLSNKPPKECSHCNKLFCQTCLKKLQTQSEPNNQKCPNCRQSQLFRPMNKLLQQMIEQIPLKHKCHGRKNYSLISFQNLIKHLSEDCIRFGKIHTCPCCEMIKKYTKKQLKGHLEIGCDHVEFKCQKQCECFVKKRELKTHDCMETIKNQLKGANKELTNFRLKENERKEKKIQDEARRAERRYRFEQLGFVPIQEGHRGPRRLELIRQRFQDQFGQNEERNQPEQSISVQSLTQNSSTQQIQLSPVVPQSDQGQPENLNTVVANIDNSRPPILSRPRVRIIEPPLNVSNSDVNLNEIEFQSSRGTRRHPPRRLRLRIGVTRRLN